MSETTVKPCYEDDQVRLFLGNCLEVLAGMEPCSIDAVVCDPPYALTELPVASIADALAAWTGGNRAYIPATGAGFMGRKWDKFVPPPAAWDQCMRVLKPGGHLLAFSAPRTQDLMGVSIRLAGFEIRDGIDWLFGSGFPKSLDVSTGIDRLKRRDYVLAAIRLGLDVPGNNLHDWTKAEHSPGDEWWGKFKAHLSPEEWGCLEREVTGKRTSGATAGMQQLGASGIKGGTYDVTAPATEDAARWSGFGTALKPAHEPIIVARKPLEGTVAANVLEYGTGALNIDGCRVAHASDADRAESEGKNRHADFGSGPRDNHVFGADDRARAEQGNYDGSAGRWPPNVLLGEEAADELDRQSTGTRAAKPSKTGNAGRAAREGIYGDGNGLPRNYTAISRDDPGGASRFFPVFRYEAKADASERPRLADGTTHPTVKPLSLVRWLVRLVTPPGGLVLDPFGGSGTTGEACVIEGFRCILIERDPEYAELIRARLSKPIQPDLFGGAVIAVEPEERHCERVARRPSQGVLADWGDL